MARIDPNCPECHGEGGGEVADGDHGHWVTCTTCFPSREELARRNGARWAGTPKAAPMFLHPDGSTGAAESSAAAMHAPLA